MAIGRARAACGSGGITRVRRCIAIPTWAGGTGEPARRDDTGHPTVVRVPVAVAQTAGPVGVARGPAWLPVARPGGDPMKKGPLFEAQSVAYLREIFPAAERRVMGGKRDRGDVGGIHPAVVLEMKNSPDYLRKLSGWVNEAIEEARNAGARIWMVWHKRAGKGSPADCYVTMDGQTARELLAAWVREQER